MGAEAMWIATDRQQAILRRAVADRIVRIKDLAHEHGVHEMTVRRDLDFLAEVGQLERIHGGARLLDRNSEELSANLRAAQNPEGKERIASAALDLIQDGDTIAIDASTTSLALARLLSKRRVHVFATSLDAAEALAARGVSFALIGGQFHPPARSFVGTFFNEALSRLHPDKVFFGAKGFNVSDGFTDPHLPEAEAKLRLLKSGAMRIALVDHTKFGRRSLATIATIDEVDMLISDRELAPEFALAFESADVRVVVAHASSKHTAPPSFARRGQL